MKNCDINIRDPFILKHNGKYYLYGSRAANFGRQTKGFDVYIGYDLENWDGPKAVFDSEKYGLNTDANWAPEVHCYNGKFYMFATFTQDNGLRGTYSLVSDAPDKEFKPVSDKPLTPEDWCCLDGTLYVDKNNKPYLVFCHEWVQIGDGTMCYIPLSEDLSYATDKPTLMFHASDAIGVEKEENKTYVTDGPFMYRGKNNKLYMIWSTFINRLYAECIAVSDNGDITGNFIQQKPICNQNSGHGMLFTTYENDLKLILHSPNTHGQERPLILNIDDTGETLKLFDK